MILPPQQILQANGKASITALKMSPNSSVLIADTTAPIVWKCVSDGLGNVTAEAFDITHHKTEEETEKETLNSTLKEINERLKKLEVNYESVINRHNESAIKTAYADNANGFKSTGGYTANGSK
jgi:hypothetical protein